MEVTLKGGSKKATRNGLAEFHRRLVCFCRLTEVMDINKREKKAGAHQRGVFLFNDVMVVTKSVAGKSASSKSSSSHQFRQTLNLLDVRINVFSTEHYQYGIQMQDRLTGKVVLTLNARSKSDQARFVDDLQESAAETMEMAKAKEFLNQPEEESMC